jgi:hypothetical protein
MAKRQQGLHLVKNSKRSEGLSEKASPKTRLRAGPFTAEIYVSDHPPQTVYHYVILRKGSAEVLAWGQAYEFEMAETEARQHLETLVSQEPSGGLATAEPA